MVQGLFLKPTRFIMILTKWNFIWRGSSASVWILRSNTWTAMTIQLGNIKRHVANHCFYLYKSGLIDGRVEDWDVRWTYKHNDWGNIRNSNRHWNEGVQHVSKSGLVASDSRSRKIRRRNSSFKLVPTKTSIKSPKLDFPQQSFGPPHLWVTNLAYKTFL